MNNLTNFDEQSRRRFMAATAKTFLGVGAMGMATRSGAGTGPGLNLPVKKDAPDHLIYLYMGGGMTHVDTFDPKPGHANQGASKVIDTNVDGIQIGGYLPGMAKHADKMAIIRSLTSKTGAHQQANYFMHTAYEQRATIRHPGMGAWMLKYRGKLNNNLPGSVFVGGNSRILGGAGFFGPQFEPLALKDPKSGLKNSVRRGDMTEEDFEQRLKLANTFDKEFRNTYDLEKVRAYTTMYDDAVRIMKSEDLKVFKLEDEEQETRAMYGENPFGQGCLLARRLVERNVRAVEVSYGGWDMHNGIFERAPDRCAVLDQAVTALIEDLERIGKLDKTMIVLTTEFGRTPRINQNAGRDHYPKAFSSVLAGGGIKGGTVYGKTDEGAENVVEDKIDVPDFNATIAHGLGLPIDQVLYSPTQRPFTVAHKGKPVMDVLA